MAQPAPAGTQAGWGSGGDTGATAEEQAGDVWLGREPLVAPRIIDDPAGAAPKALASGGVPPPDADTELPDINVPGMPFNDEAQELLRQAAAIQAAPSGSGGPDAAGVADERGMAGDGGGGKAASGAGEGHLVGEHVHERKGHPERSFPQ